MDSEQTLELIRIDEGKEMREVQKSVGVNYCWFKKIVQCGNVQFEHKQVRLKSLPDYSIVVCCRIAVLSVLCFIYKYNVRVFTYQFPLSIRDKTRSVACAFPILQL